MGKLVQICITDHEVPRQKISFNNNAAICIRMKVMLMILTEVILTEVILINMDNFNV